jgi:hypothetical protein
MSFLKSKQPGYYCQAIAINKKGESKQRFLYADLRRADT